MITEKSVGLALPGLNFEARAHKSLLPAIVEIKMAGKRHFKER